MAILNYTTQIAAEKTIMEIQQMLVKAGAKEFQSKYDDDGILHAMSFAIKTPNGMVGFKLPAHIDNVYKILCKTRNISGKYRTKEQASRTAWRIIKDWVKAQVAMIEVGMVETMEVFLPYALRPDGATMYEALVDNGMKLLT